MCRILFFGAARNDMQPSAELQEKVLPHGCAGMGGLNITTVIVCKMRLFCQFGSNSFRRRLMTITTARPAGARR